MRLTTVAAVLMLTLAGCSRPSTTAETASQPTPAPAATPGAPASSAGASPDDRAPASANPQPAPASPLPAQPATTPEADHATRPSADTAREAAPAAATEPAPRFREVTLQAGTDIPVTLQTAVASDTSQTEEAVRATVRRSIVAGGVEALPAGTVVHGSVVDVARAGKVKGRARLSLRFTDIVVDDERVGIQAASITREAAATTKKDAKKVAIPAAGGAIIGAIAGGGQGAAIGAAVGGGAGTAVVMSTRGDEVRVPAGTSLTIRLTEPVTIRVRLDGQR